MNAHLNLNAHNGQARPVRSNSAVNDYSTMAEWLTGDIGDIHDPEPIDRLVSLADRIEAEVAAPWPAHIRELCSAAELIRRSPDWSRRQSIFNDALRQLFVGTTLTEERYLEHCEELQSGDGLAYRRESRNPLPTMDAIAVLASDPRSPSQAARAALLTAAALNTHANDRSGLPILGTTLVPGEASDGLVAAAALTRVLVLAEGVAYTVAIAAEDSAVRLQEIFEAIQADAARFLRQPGAWAGAVPALVTAASRGTCYRIRRMLEMDSQNAQRLAEIDGCLFAVCLDAPDPSSAVHSISGLERTEAISRHLFTAYGNRWFGMTCLIIGADGEAGLIGSYTRGHEAIPVLAFADSLYRQSVNTPLPASYTASLSSSILPAGASRIEFQKMDLGTIEADALAETNACFHQERAFFDLKVGTSFFQSLDMSPNAALQYLLMLAAQETYGTDSLPAVSHAVSTRAGAGLKGGLDWIVVSSAPAKGILEAANDPYDEEALLDRFRQAVQQHATKVRAARQGYSPSSFLRSPSGKLDEMVYQFFAEIGARYETAYRSYLFRATRWNGTMDILTSTLRLPESVVFCGRPGATNEVAGMFGLHIVMAADHTSLFFIPNSARSKSLKKFHSVLENWAEELQEAAMLTSQGRDQKLCA